jgi:putative PIN family toxin of toxin-antitoxin system
MLDTNVIISAGLFPESNVGKVLSHIAKNHKLVLCQYTMNELKNVFMKKFPKRKEHLSNFVKELKYELIESELLDYNNYPKIRDIDDIPLLAYAIKSNVNLFITGDKDFDEINIENPKIINPRKYFEEYME